jgi:transposase
MELLFERVAGLDVHRDTVMACVRFPKPNGKGRLSETREFSTTVSGLRVLRDWLTAQAVSHVAMEATGVYWVPVYVTLEDDFELLLVNAAHMRNVPGRKTDVADAGWIAQLLEHGLLRASFVPPREFRQLRNLCRYRRTIVAERVRVIQRVEKTLQDAGIKLTSVASTVLTLSGRDMLNAMVAGERDPARLAELARGRLRPKIAALTEALAGRFDDHHGVLIGQALAHIDQLDASIAEVSVKIAALNEPHVWALELLETIPGVSRRIAEIVVSEIGVNMAVFPTAGHLSSWAGLCPGNNTSAGRTGPGSCRPGSPWLRQALVEAAWAASRTKTSYLSARHARLRSRRGKERAVIATAHSILVASWHMLSKREPFNELGHDYYSLRHSPQTEAQRLLKRLAALGVSVTVQPAA